MSDDLRADTVMPRLATKWLGQTYWYEEEVDSTNTRMDELADRGEVHGAVMVADTQTVGRGRLSRQWHSPAGLNLYFSVLLRPNWQTRSPPPISLAAGVALAEAVDSLLPVKPQLKWPNDLLCDGRKVAGILVEAASDHRSVQHVVLGIGLNVNQDQFPDSLAQQAGSLRLASGESLHRGAVLASVLSHLEVWVDCLEREGAEPIIAGWMRYVDWIGKKLSVRNGARDLVGTAVGLEPHGALRLRDENGCEHVVHCGDASLVRPGQ